MKLTKLTGLLIAACIVVFSVNSCKKSTDLTRHNSKKIKNVSDVISPTVSNGMLVFTDKDEYHAWLEYLDGSVQRDSTSEDTTTTHEIFDGIENELGFSSLRKKLWNDFEALNNVGWANYEDIPVMHFIGDQTVLSTLNEYGEVKIANEIIKFWDEEHTVVIKNESLLNSVRTFKNSGYTDITEIYQIDESLKPGDDLEIMYTNDASDELSFSKPTGGTLAQENGAIIQDPCNAKLVYVKDYRLVDLNTPINATYNIYWGDGQSSSQTTYSNNLSQISHTYSSNGNYTITIVATPWGGSGYIGSYSWTIAVKVENACRRDSRYSGHVWKATSDNMRATNDYISASVDKKGYVNRVYASSEAFVWKNNSWHREKADRLYVQSCAEVLNYSDCSTWYNNCPITEHKKDAFVQVGFSPSAKFGWNVVYGIHKIYHNSNWYTHNLSLSPCP